jgi:hypothetical protein
LSTAWSVVSLNSDIKSISNRSRLQQLERRSQPLFSC